MQIFLGTINGLRDIYRVRLMPRTEMKSLDRLGDDYYIIIFALVNAVLHSSMLQL